MRTCPLTSTILVLSMGAACARAAPSSTSRSPPRTIEVEGRGTVEAAPDEAEFRVGVEISAAPSVEAAREGAARAMSRMLAALTEEGVPEEARRTTSLTITPQYAYVKRERQLRGYTARHGLEVHVTRLERVSSIIDAVVSAGGDATRFRGVSFGLSDRDAVEAKARAKAVAQARRRAEQLARALGNRLGPVLLIREGGPAGGPSPPPAPMAMRASAEAPPTPVSPGEVVVAVEIFARWALED